MVTNLQQNGWLLYAVKQSLKCTPFNCGLWHIAELDAALLLNQKQPITAFRSDLSEQEFYA